MNDADRAKLRETEGCGEHRNAIYEVDKCDPCLDLLMEAARAGAVEECIRAVCVQCGRDIEVELHEGFWRHVYMSGQTGRCLADPIRRALLNPSSPPAAEGARGCKHIGAPFRGDCPECDKELP